MKHGIKIWIYWLVLVPREMLFFSWIDIYHVVIMCVEHRHDSIEFTNLSGRKNLNLKVITSVMSIIELYPVFMSWCSSHCRHKKSHTYWETLHMSLVSTRIAWDWAWPHYTGVSDVHGSASGQKPSQARPSPAKITACSQLWLAWGLSKPKPSCQAMALCHICDSFEITQFNSSSPQPVWDIAWPE